MGEKKTTMEINNQGEKMKEESQVLERKFF
jgi:hypothetical protein